MSEKTNIEERCRKILEDNGAIVADKARTILYEDPALKDLQVPLKFISNNWRDPLTPGMMSLSCEAVGGRSNKTHQAALALSLINLSFYIWDDIIDEARVKLFKPTFFGKFGGGTAIMIGGLASAKAFSVLDQVNVEENKHKIISKLLWDFLVKITRAEAVNLKLRSQKDFSSKKKLWKIKIEASDLATCLRIGAIIGGGSEREVNCLAGYGRSLGVVLALWKDLHVASNLTLELAEKIRTMALPYSLMWATERSEKLKQKIRELTQKDTIAQAYIQEIVEDVLETGVLAHSLKIIRRLVSEAKEELCEMGKKNNATQALEFFIGAQPQLFIDSLRVLQG